MFNPYDIENLLNSSTNPFYRPLEPVSLKWGLELTKNVFILEGELGTCVVSAPFTLINIEKNKELFAAVLDLQKGLLVGKFSCKPSKNAIEVIYEAVFSKALIEDVDKFQDFMDDVYEDINFMKDFSQEVEEKFIKLSNLKNNKNNKNNSYSEDKYSKEDFDEEGEGEGENEDEDEVDLDYVNNALQDILDSENNKEEKSDDES